MRAEGRKWVRCEFTRDHSVCYGRICFVMDDQDGDEGNDEPKTFSTVDKLRAGAMLRIGCDGELETERGLIAPEDAKAEAKRQTGAIGGSPATSGYAAAHGAPVGGAPHCACP